METQIYNKNNKLNMINSNIRKKVYESKKARDILDEEFVEFAPIKRNINEFFSIYDSKFYNIIPAVHSFFSEQSINYVKDYVNPKQLQAEELERQKQQIQIDIDSIEQFHPIFPNNVVLTAGGDSSGADSSYTYYLIQSGKRRVITSMGMVAKVKDTFRHKNKSRKEWTIDVGSAVIAGIPAGPKIEKDEDLFLPLYTINTLKELPSNIYIG